MDVKDRLMQLKCCILIPTYNNEQTVRSVVEQARCVCSDVVVVNDGATDSTANVLDCIEGITVLTHEENRGKGEALKTGLRFAAENGFDYAIAMDSDGQHFVDDVPAFADALEKEPGAFIVGVRDFNQENMPGKNTFANKFSNFWFRFETGQDLSDTQCGFRCYPLKQLKDMTFITGRYEFELEVLVRAAWRGVKLVPLPIKVFYAPAGERVSHFRPLQDFTRISILNTVFVLVTILWIKPRDFFRSLSKKKIEKFIKENITESDESNLQIAMAFGFGVFMGIVPIWGWQIVVSLALAHWLGLNKVFVFFASNISVPPIIPFILYGSYYTGGLLLGRPDMPDFSNISLESVKADLLQYVCGSMVFASVCGVAVFVLSYLLLLAFRDSKEEI